MPWLYTAGNYDGTVAIYFEVVMKISSGSYTAYAELYSGAASVTGSELTTTSTSEVRLRSGDISGALSDGGSYRVRIKSSNASGTTTLYQARIIIVQTGTITKTETVFTLESNSTTTGTSYTDASNSGIYLWDANQFDGTVAVYFEAYLSGQTVSDTAYAQLATTGGSAVSSSEVSSTGSTDTRVRSSAVTLADDTEYVCQIKTSSSTGRVRAARIIIVQTATPTKTESYYPTNSAVTIASGTTEVSDFSKAYYDADEWSVSSLSAYFGGTLLRSGGTEGYNDLNDGSTDIVTLSTTNTSKTRLRSSATLSDNTEYTSQVRGATSTNVSSYLSYILFQATITAGTETSDSQPAYLAGTDTSTDSQPAHLTGTDTSSDSQPAYLSGADSATDSQPAYLAGVDTLTDSQPAYLGGQDTSTDSQPAYLAGVDTSTDAQPAYLAGLDTSTDSQPAYLAGTDGATDSQPAYLAGVDTAIDSHPAYLGGQDSSIDSQPAYLEGASGAVETSDSQPAYLAGVDTHTDSQPAYLGGQESATDSQPAYLEGSGTVVSDSQPAYMAGVDTHTDAQPAYLGGQDTSTDSQPAYLAGRDTATDSQPAHLSGQDTITDSQPAYLVGSDVSTDSQPAYLSGAGVTTDSQPAYLRGVTTGTGNLDVLFRGMWRGMRRRMR